VETREKKTRQIQGDSRSQEKGKEDMSFCHKDRGILLTLDIEGITTPQLTLIDSGSSAN
jgi:hypothetical protein